MAAGNFPAPDEGQKQMTYSVEYAGLCIQGLVRRNNEDNIWCADRCLPILHTDEEQKLSGSFLTGKEVRFAVFDGLGGEKRGEYASFLAARAFGREEKDTPESLTGSMNHDILEYARKNRIYRIGTTAVGLSFTENGLCGFNIGDSRCYRYSGGKLTQLSVDHTDGGLFGGGLTQCLGMPKEELHPAVFSVPYEEEDQYLLCSDGLTKMIGDQRIGRILSEKKTAAEKLQIMKNIVLRKGAPDNTTILILEIGRRRCALLGLMEGCRNRIKRENGI